MIKEGLRLALLGCGHWTGDLFVLCPRVSLTPCTLLRPWGAAGQGEQMCCLKTRTEHSSRKQNE